MRRTRVRSQGWARREQGRAGQGGEARREVSKTGEAADDKNAKGVREEGQMKEQRKTVGFKRRARQVGRGGRTRLS